MGRQTARRGIGRYHSISGGQTLGLELVGQHRGKGIAQLLKRLGGQFFHKQFDEKVLGCHVVGSIP
ncbi:hypothetical protein D3C71_1688010 [compost metagenome]